MEVDNGTCFSSVVDWDSDKRARVSQSADPTNIRQGPLAFEPISFWLASDGLISSARFGYVVQEIAAGLACSVAENSHR